MKIPAKVGLQRKYRYKAFISYSHRSDSIFASVLQRAIERLAKPWYRRRAIDLFRDETDLAANPGLWPRIVEALDESEHLLILGSPSAARSTWVAKEVEHWKSNHDTANLVVALTEGEIIWNEARCDFDWQATTAIPTMLAGSFKSEPLWADFRDAKAAMKDAGAFRQPAIRLAAGLRGVAPRDLESEDLRQHRRTIRFAVAGLLSLLVLTIVAMIATKQALDQRDLARSRELAALSEGRLATDPELSILLALRAEEMLPTPQAEHSLRLAMPLSHIKYSFRDDGPYFNSLSFSSDGKRIVTSSGWALWGIQRDFKARIWNAETGKVLATFVGTAPMRKSSFSPDGHLVVTIGSGQGAWLWTADTGSLVAALHGDQATVNSASFSPDGSRVVTAGNGGAAFVWSTGAATPPIRLNHPDGVNDASFSPDGLSIVTATGQWRLLDNVAQGLYSDREKRFIVVVWDVRTMHERLRLLGFQAPVRLARFSPDGKRIATVSDDNIARLWDAQDGHRIAELRKHTAAITAISFSSDGQWLVTASDDTTARVWNAWTGVQRVELHGHKQPLCCVAISRDGTIVVTAGADRYAMVWDVATAKPLGELRGHTESITGLQLSPDENLIGTTSHDGTVRLWHIPPGGPVEPMGPVGEVEKMALSTNGERILVENNARQVNVWERRTAAPLATLIPAQVFLRPAWSADGTRVVVPVESNRVRLYDAGTGEFIKELGGTDAGFEVVALSPDGARVAAFERIFQRPKPTLAIWDVASGKVIVRVEMDITPDSGGIQFSPDGKRLLIIQFAVGGSQLRDAATGARIAGFPGRNTRFSRSGQRILEIDGGNCLSNVYDAHSGTQVASLAFPRGCFTVSDAAISSDDRQVLVYDSGGKAAIWDLAGPHIASEFAMSLSVGETFVLSPDARLIAVTGQRTVKIWDLHSKKQIKVLSDSPGDVTAATFTADGTALITAGKDGTIRVYPAETFLPLEDLVRRARSTVSRALSEAEMTDLSSD